MTATLTAPDQLETSTPAAEGLPNSPPLPPQFDGLRPFFKAVREFDNDLGAGTMTPARLKGRFESTIAMLRDASHVPAYVQERVVEYAVRACDALHASVDRFNNAMSLRWPGTDFMSAWSGLADAKRLLQGEFSPRRLETIRELQGQGVSPEQIAAIYEIPLAHLDADADGNPRTTVTEEAAKQLRMGKEYVPPAVERAWREREGKLNEKADLASLRRSLRALQGQPISLASEQADDDDDSDE